MKWSVQRWSRAWVSRSHMFTWLTMVAPLGEERGGEGDAHAPAQVAEDVVGRGGVDELVAGDGGERQGGERHEDEAPGAALDEAWEGERPRVDAQGQARHHVEADGVDHAAEGEEHALVHPRHETPADDQREHVAKPAGSEDESRGPRVVAEELLGEHGEEEHAREHAEPDQGDEGRARGEIAIGEDGEVEDGLASHQLADDESHERGSGEHGEDDDEARVEPILALAAVEEELETAETQHHEAESRPVHTARLAQVWRIEEEGAGHEEAEDAHG